jgi:hypothetical protein
MAVDAEGAVQAWINSRTTDLVGLGNPLQLGAHFIRLRSPASGAYALLYRIGGGRAFTAERPWDQARISATIYAPTKETACRAAVAYVNALESVNGAAVVMGDAVCQVVDNITGPLAIDDSATGHEQHRYVVDADFYLVLATALA